MSNYTCYIINDETFSISNLITYIDRIPNLSIVAFNLKPTEAIKEINNGLQPDILFLDINMPKLSGLDVIDIISKDIAVIFITEEMKYTLDAFDKNAIEFLPKPISFEKLEKVVIKVQSKICEKNKNDISENTSIFITAGSKGKLVQIKFEDVIFIESSNHYLHIQTINGKHITYLSMQEVQEELLELQFIRVHKSFIVNIERIKELTRLQILLTDDYRVPLGETFKDELMKKINVKRAKKQIL